MQFSSILLAQAADTASSLMSFLPIILMFAVLYFVMIRPQVKRQKEHRNMVSALQKGDEIITNGGILGKINDVKESYLVVEISEVNGQPVEMIVQRAQAASVLPKGTIKAL